MDDRFWDSVDGPDGESVLVAAAARALVENTRDIVLLMSEDGQILLANTAAEFAYGWARDQLKTMNVRELRVPDLRPAADAQMREAVEHGILFECEHRRVDGTTFPVEVSSRGLVVEGTVFLLSVIRDITVRREREAEREALVADLEAANHQLEGLLRIVSSAVGRLDVSVLLREVLAALRDVMKADAALLFVRQDDGSMRLLASDGYEAVLSGGFTLAEGEGFVAAVAESGDLLWVPDVTVGATHIPIHDEADTKAMVGVPLNIEGRLFGVLECAWSSDRMVNEAERVMLRVASDRIVSALVGAQRFEGTNRVSVLESALAEASMVLASSHETALTVPSALGILARAIGCDVAAFGLMHKDGFEVLHGVGVEPCCFEVPGHGPVMDWPEGESVVRVDSRGRYGPWLAETLSATEALIIPVQVRGDRPGAVVFGVRESEGGLDDLATEYGRRLSVSLALAYANARDYQWEHRIAETLQEALLTLEGEVRGVRFSHLYRSATLETRVGGDFYDVFTMPDGRVGVLVGDVSGKGLEAAVLTTLVKHTIRAFAHESGSPADVLRRANEALAATSRLRDFASVALVIIDAATGSATYCTAGHPPAMVIRQTGGVEAMRCGSPVLGAFVDMEFFECDFTILPGDTLVLYTDGVTEARAAEGGFFGEERLVHLLDGLRDLESDAVADRIFSEVEEYSGGRFSDDVAIVSLSLA